MTEHKYAEILRAIADGKEIEVRDSSGVWNSFPEYITIEFIGLGGKPPSDFRIKPKTITINGHEVPAPHYGEMEIGQRYFYPDIWEGRYYDRCTWDDGEYEKRAKERGLIHLTEEAALAHGKALASLTEIKK